MVVFTQNLRPVKIEQNTNGDSRFADHVPTIKEFNDANSDHRRDVMNMIELFSKMLQNSAMHHDWSKVDEPYRSMFYRDLVSTMEGRIKFEDGEWFDQHFRILERHHLDVHAPDDVDLFDVIEMVCDCVAAGMARGGDVRPIHIESGVLQKAVENTANALAERVEIVK